MATHGSIKKSCCKCNKGGATFICDGCYRAFCLKHASDHRQELSQQMDSIGQQHDILRRDIDQHNINKTLFEQIDRWEKESIENIRSAAETVRLDLKQLTEESKKRINNLMNKLSDELRSNRESDDYKEDDLDRWVKQLEELRKEIEKSSDIKIVTSNLSSLSLIKVIKINAFENNVTDLVPQNTTCFVERFKEVIGPVIVSDDGRSAISMSKLSDAARFSSTCGVTLYSSGIHRLRSRINTSRSSGVFFGIIKSSEIMTTESARLASAYGCWSHGRLITKGIYATKYEKLETLPNDEVTITLDCDARQFSYLHERTKKIVTVLVEEYDCPLPWKLVVTLWYPGDKIEILNS